LNRSNIWKKPKALCVC